MICQRCILPDSYHGIHFDENGVCNICNYYDKKWGQKDDQKSEAELDRIIEHYRARKGRYDCIVPLSGAKDSTYVLYYLKKKSEIMRKFKLPSTKKNFGNTTHGRYYGIEDAANCSTKHPIKKCFTKTSPQIHQKYSEFTTT